MDFKQKLIEAFDNSDWDQLVNLAIEIRKSNSKESFFGLRKNCFNIIQSSYGYESYGIAKEVMGNLGFYIIGKATSQFVKKVKEGEIKVEDAAKNVAIITKSNDMPGALSQLKFPYTYFQFRVKDNSEEIYQAKRNGTELPNKRKWFYLKNLETGEEFDFDENTIQAFLREEKIDSILED
jgi:hypothetical protein